MRKEYCVLGVDSVAVPARECVTSPCQPHRALDRVLKGKYGLGEALGPRGWWRCWRSFMQGPYVFPFQKASAKALKSPSHLEKFPESAFHCSPNTSCLFFSTAFHEVSVYPKKELPFFILFTAGLCSFTAMLALLTHQFPELMGVFAKAVSICQERGLRQGAGKVMKSSIRETGRVM